MLDMTSLLMGRAPSCFAEGCLTDLRYTTGAYVLDLRSDYTQTDTWHYNVLVQRSYGYAALSFLERERLRLYM